MIVAAFNPLKSTFAATLCSLLKRGPFNSNVKLLTLEGWLEPIVAMSADGPTKNTNPSVYAHR